MPPTEEAVFASLVQDAETFPDAVALVKARDERIRRTARNEALEEAARKAVDVAAGWRRDIVQRVGMATAASIRALKVSP